MIEDDQACELHISMWLIIININIIIYIEYIIYSSQTYCVVKSMQMI